MNIRYQTSSNQLIANRGKTWQYLIAEHLNLTISTMEGGLCVERFIESINLNVQRKPLDTLLVAKVGAEALNRDANL